MYEFGAGARGGAQRLRVEAGASASGRSPPGPNNMEKTTKSEALGASSVTPKSGEISRRVFFEGFHAMVGPMTTQYEGVSPASRISASVKEVNCISAPTLSRSRGRIIGNIMLWAKPTSR